MNNQIKKEGVVNSVVKIYGALLSLPAPTPPPPPPPPPPRGVVGVGVVLPSFFPAHFNMSRYL